MILDKRNLPRVSGLIKPSAKLQWAEGSSRYLAIQGGIMKIKQTVIKKCTGGLLSAETVSFLLNTLFLPSMISLLLGWLRLSKLVNSGNRPRRGVPEMRSQEMHSKWTNANHSQLPHDCQASSSSRNVSVSSAFSLALKPSRHRKVDGKTGTLGC